MSMRHVGRRAVAQGSIVLKNYAGRMEASWVYEELERVRNIRPGFRCVLAWMRLQLLQD